MGRYLVINVHTPAECEAQEADMDKIGPELKGVELMCTCPGGEHTYYMILNGDSAEQVMGYFPPSFKLGKMRAVPLESMRL